MDIHIESALDIGAFIHGLIFGLILLFQYKKKPQAIFLSLFLLMSASELAKVLIIDLGLTSANPRLYYLPVNFTFAYPTLIFIYTKNLMTPLKVREFAIHMIPGAIEVLYYATIFFLPQALFEQYLNSSWDGSVFFVVIVGWATLNLTYSVATLVLLRKQKRALGFFYSEANLDHLRWLKWLCLYIILLGSSVLILQLFLYDHPICRDPITNFIWGFADIVLVYWIGIIGYTQTQKVIPKDFLIQLDANNVHQLASSYEQNKTYDHIISVLIEHKLYKDRHLTIADLAKHAGLSVKKVSQLINLKADMNFNQMINEYRVEEAKRMLASSEFDHYSILGIAFDVGYKSKATFFSNFKKIAGCTPLVYKRRLLLKSRSTEV